MKIIIAGGRDFSDYPLLKERVMYLTSKISDFEIVSGAARGADALGERFAKENNIPVTLFPADWDAHGKKAGIIRNEQMAKYADALIAFWDGKSRGTKNMIELAKSYNLKTRVVLYQNKL